MTRRLVASPVVIEPAHSQTYADLLAGGGVSEVYEKYGNQRQ